MAKFSEFIFNKIYYFKLDICVCFSFSSGVFCIFFFIFRNATQTYKRLVQGESTADEVSELHSLLSLRSDPSV